MKIRLLSLISALFLTPSVWAVNAENCGTSNQWNEGEVSGWFFEIDYRSSTAFVVKHETNTVRRAYSYKLDHKNAQGFLLTSDYNDVLQFSKISQDQYAVVYRYNNEVTQSFQVTCFSKSKIANIPASHSPLAHLKSVSMVEDAQPIFYVQKTQVDFYLLASVIQSSISHIGDWEDTILNSTQAAIIDSGSGLNAEEQKLFEHYKQTIAADIKANPGLKQIGYLFGRDWYYGTGTIAFVLSYKNFIVVVPFEFGGDAQFGDERLDYLY